MAWLLKIEEDELLLKNQWSFDTCQIQALRKFQQKMKNNINKINKCQNHIGCKDELLKFKETSFFPIIKVNKH